MPATFGDIGPGRGNPAGSGGCIRLGENPWVKLWKLTVEYNEEQDTGYLATGRKGELRLTGAFTFGDKYDRGRQVPAESSAR